MNQDEAKTILLLYRPGAADANDPQVAEALNLAKRDVDLGKWLQKHCAQQVLLRDQFRQIIVPDGLKEQIISEEAARRRRIALRPRMVLAAAMGIILLGLLAITWQASRPHDDTLAVFQNRMAGIALRGYAMDLTTNNPAQIRAYLAKNHAPANFVLPAALQKVTPTGCAIESWQDTKVSMICFHTGKSLPPGQNSDLWLFVVDRPSIRDSHKEGSAQFSKVNRLVMATWTQGDKLFLLGTEGDEQSLRQYL